MALPTLNRRFPPKKMITMFLGDKMKKICIEWAFSVLVGLVAPFSMLSAINGAELSSPDILPNDMPDYQIHSQVTIPVIHDSGDVEIMELDSYLTGVVLAEMPAAFEAEAIKAQAVVARTYTMKRIESGDKHNQGAVCTNPACCQAYCSPEEYLNKGNPPENLDKVEKAVLSTSGRVLRYQGQYIDATYFSCSGGRTEDAAAVWGTDVPYLQAVDSPGEEHASHYTDTVTIPVNEFLQKLDLEPTGVLRIGKITYTDGSGVDTIEIAGKTLRGTQVRQKLGLRSTVFTIQVLGDSVSITTKGYGHRVGMSQYGAQAMAKSGKRYPEILQYYYTGTILDAIVGN